MSKDLLIFSFSVSGFFMLKNILYCINYCSMKQSIGRNNACIKPDSFR